MHNTTCAVGVRRLFTLVPEEKQVKDLLNHVDSPYIRAVSPFNARAWAIFAAWVGGAAIFSTSSKKACCGLSGGLPVPALRGQPAHAVGADPSLRARH